MLATRSCTFALFLAVLTGATAKTQTPSFTPDGFFQGSSLAGWHTIGQAAWSAADGTITGDGGAGHGAGWLMLDHSYQDTGLYAQFRCQGDCDTGVLLRAHKTEKGMEASLSLLKETNWALTI